MTMTRTGLALVFLCLACQASVHELSNGGKKWAVLVAGSSGFENYRHQADVCHSYQILHANGIPDENIIVMMYDDIAYNSENARKGVIINRPGGPNVYKGVPKDYTNVDVNSTNFLKVLKGDEDGMRGVGSGRVVKSGPHDHIFVYFSDHGAPGLIAFPNDELYADALLRVLKGMAEENKFAKMVLYVEACESGSMFDGLLPDDLNIFGMTAADPNESSYAVYFDDVLDTYLGDVFSVMWMEDSEQEILFQEKIHHQFEVVRSETNTSHVEEYGDLDLGSMHVSDFIGFRLTSNGASADKKFPALNDVVSSRDVPLAILERKRDKEVHPRKKKHYSFHIHKMKKYRRHMEGVVEEILTLASGGKEWKHDAVRMQLEHFPCYKNIVSKFSQKCFKISENPHALTQLHFFANICVGNVVSEDSVLKAIAKVCSSRPLLRGIK